MVEFMNKKLNNPLIASSCIATEKESSISLLVEFGVSGVILKSCADYTRGEVDGKREFANESDTGYTYASSPFQKEIMTLDESISLLNSVSWFTENTLKIPSLTAESMDPDKWIPACKVFEKAGADGIQLDFFYMGTIIGTDGFSQKLTSLLKEIMASVNIPIMPKLNVNLPKDYIIPLIKDAGVEYVSLLDSVRSPYLEYDEKTREYSVSNRLDPETTSCFGHWQLPLTLGYTYTAAKHGLKVCAGGGITSYEDVQKLLAAGATTVQSATYVTKSPLGVLQLINRPICC